MSVELKGAVSLLTTHPEMTTEGTILVGVRLPVEEARRLRLGQPVTVTIPEGAATNG